MKLFRGWIYISTIFYISSARVDQFIWQTRLLVDHITSGPEKGEPMKFLEELCDDFGPRHTGSKALEKSIDWLVGKLKEDGFENVYTEKVDNLPHWVRGEDVVEMTEPRRHKLNVLAIGGSPSGFVSAEVIVVSNYGELARMNYVGKIVVIAEPYTSYGRANTLRSAALVLEKRGAKAVLLSSATPLSLYTPHTGSGARGSRIPSACLTEEEAQMLLRLYKRGKKIKMHVYIRSRDMRNTVSSRNTIVDIKGSKKPTEIVVISAHMDSWDIGQGAVDDGGGVAAIRSALRAIKYMSEHDRRFKPERTIRAIFWTGEEQGYLGAKAYAEAHEKDNIIFVAETDQGAFRPRLRNSTLHFMGDTGKMYRIEEIAKLLRYSEIPLSVNYSESQGDVYYLAIDRNIPAVSYVPDKGNDYYFSFHHSAADYINAFEEGDLEYTAGIFASLAHVIANMDEWW